MVTAEEKQADDWEQDQSNPFLAERGVRSDHPADTADKELRGDTDKDSVNNHDSLAEKNVS